MINEFGSERNAYTLKKLCALLEPHGNPEISQACLLLAGKLQPFLSSPSSVLSAVEPTSFSSCLPSSAPPAWVPPNAFFLPTPSPSPSPSLQAFRQQALASTLSDQRQRLLLCLGGGGGGGGGRGGVKKCNRGGGAASLLLAAANRSGEELQQRRQGYLEDGYLQHQPPPNALTTSSAPENFYPHASCVPVAEDPPADDIVRQLLCSVLSQARSCLPGVSFTQRHGVTSPDEVLKHVIQGKGASELAKSSPASSSGSSRENTLQSILFTVQVCEEAEVMDAVLQLDYWLSAIKLACLSNKYVSFTFSTKSTP